MNLLVRNKERIKIGCDREEFVTRIQNLYSSRKNWKEDRIVLIDSASESAELTIQRKKNSRDIQISAFIQFKWEEGESYVDVEYSLYPQTVELLFNIAVIGNLSIATIIFGLGQAGLLEKESSLLQNVYAFVLGPLFFWIVMQMVCASSINRLSDLLKETLK